MAGAAHALEDGGACERGGGRRWGLCAFDHGICLSPRGGGGDCGLGSGLGSRLGGGSLRLLSLQGGGAEVAE